MSTTLPVVFSAAPLPVQFKGTPQEIMDAIVARLRIESEEAFSIISIASTQPTSNVGPWLKDGVSFRVWDVGSGAYIPLILEDRSLRYIASQSAPNPAQFTFWIELNGSDKAIAIKYYNVNTSTWEDVYDIKFATFATTTALNTAITNVTTAYVAAIAAQAVVDSNARRQFPFRSRKSAAAQSYVAGTGDTVVVFDVEDFDSGANFASNQFVAPATGIYTFKASSYVSLSAGAPTAIDRQLKLRVNGVVVTRKNIQITDLTGGATMDVSDTQELTAGDIVDVVVNITSTGASTWSILNDSTNTFFTGNRVLTQ